MEDLSGCYRIGRGVPKDGVEAANWLRKAAEQGSVEAMEQLGYCYRFGRGVPEDEAESINWHRKAAELGSARAMEVLSDRYFLGIGVLADESEAMNWLRKAAECDGHNLAKLGMRYLYLRNDEEAVQCFRKAAEQGSDRAQYMLGECYRYGWGVPQDAEEAAECYRKAKRKGPFSDRGRKVTIDCS